MGDLPDTPRPVRHHPGCTRTRGGRHGRHAVRRHRGRRTVRRVTHGDAPGPQGLPGARRRPGHLPERHRLHPPGVAALDRWGLLAELTGTGCPPIDTYVFDFGAFALSGAPGTDEHPVAYAPRRTVLDKLLLDAASGAGAEV